MFGWLTGLSLDLPEAARAPRRAHPPGLPSSVKEGAHEGHYAWMFSTLKVSLSAATAFAPTSSGATTRWNPPTIRWILGLMAAAVDRRVRAADHKHGTANFLRRW
jgi:hypothetical protein